MKKELPKAKPLKRPPKSDGNVEARKARNDRYKNRRERDLEHASARKVKAIEAQEAASCTVKEAQEARRIQKLENRVEKHIERTLDPDLRPRLRESSKEQLDNIARTLRGRQLFDKALEKRGITLDTYAEMVQISAEVGRGETYEVNNVTGEAQRVFQDSAVALANRRHVTESIEKVKGLQEKDAGGDVTFNIVFINADGSKQETDSGSIDIPTVREATISD